MKNSTKKINSAKFIPLMLIVLAMFMPLVSAGAVFPEPSNLTSPLKSIDYINKLTDVGAGPMLGTVIYFLLVMALFMGMKSYTTERAAAVALFVASIIGILLRIMQWVNDTIVYLSLILMIFALFQLWKKND